VAASQILFFQTLDFQGIACGRVMAGEGPKIDHVVARRAHPVADQIEIRHIPIKAGGHLGHALAIEPRISAVDHDLRYFAIKRGDSLGILAVPSGSIGGAQSKRLLLRNRHVTPKLSIQYASIGK